jgi:hypothetical protein
MIALIPLLCLLAACFGLFLLIFRKGYRLKGFVLFAFALPATVGAIALTAPKTPAELEKAAHQAALDAEAAAYAKDHGTDCLSPWNGSHKGLNILITDQLRDPASFEMLETRTAPVNDKGVNMVFVEYTAKNGFGGTDRATAVGFFDNATCAPTLVSLE